MRIVKLILILFLILVLGASAFTYFYKIETVDGTPPRITSDRDVLEVLSGATDEALCQGLSATDDRDGDLTGQIIVDYVSGLIDENSAKITYVVFDSAGNAGTLTRTVCFTDYTSPRFALTEPLVYSVGSMISLTNRLCAYDVVDGDISGDIRISSQNLVGTTAGIYTIQAQVSNTLGDTALVEFPLVMQLGVDLPRITLDTYLLYLSQGERFEPREHIENVYDPADAGASARKVVIDNKVDTAVPGIYQVQYQYTGQNGVGVVFLTVVVE